MAIGPCALDGAGRAQALQQTFDHRIERDAEQNPWQEVTQALDHPAAIEPLSPSAPIESALGIDAGLLRPNLAGDHRGAVGAQQIGVEILFDGVRKQAAPVLDLQARLDQLESFLYAPSGSVQLLEVSAYHCAIEDGRRQDQRLAAGPVQTQQAKRQGRAGFAEIDDGVVQVAIGEPRHRGPARIADAGTEVGAPADQCMKELTGRIATVHQQQIPGAHLRQMLACERTLVLVISADPRIDKGAAGNVEQARSPRQRPEPARRHVHATEERRAFGHLRHPQGGAIDGQHPTAMPRLRLRVRSEHVGAVAQQRAQCGRLQLPASLAQRALGQRPGGVRVQGMIKEGIEFGLQAAARRVEQEGHQSRQRKLTFAHEGGGRDARQLGKGVGVKKLAELGEDGTGFAMSWSFSESTLRSKDYTLSHCCIKRMRLT